MLNFWFYRKEALDHFESSSDLEESVGVVRPKMAWALGAVWAVLLALLVWAVLGQLPEVQRGQGVFLPVGGFDVVSIPRSGTVSAVKVQESNRVVQGDILGWIQPRLGRRIPIRAPETGRVISISVTPGDLVHTSQRAFTLAPDQQDLYLAAFVSDAGPLLAPGLDVHVYPQGVSSAEFGYIHGAVESVSDFPLTRHAATQLLGNSSFVKHFFNENVAYLVKVRLKKRSHPGSDQYQWSSQKRFSQSINAGTLANVRIILREKRPITFLFPFLKH